MAAIIFAIGMCIGGFAALVAFSNNIFGDPLTQPVVENKILTYEFCFQSGRLCLPGIIDNAAFQMIHMFKPMV